MATIAGKADSQRKQQKRKKKGGGRGERGGQKGSHVGGEHNGRRREIQLGHIEGLAHEVRGIQLVERAGARRLDLLRGGLLERLLVLHGWLAGAREAHVGDTCRQGIDTASCGCASAGVAVVGVAVADSSGGTALHTKPGLLDIAVLGIVPGVRDSLCAVATVRRCANGLHRGTVLAGRWRLTSGGARRADVEGISSICSLLLLSMFGGRSTCRWGCLCRLLLVLETLLAVRRRLPAVLLSVRGRHGSG